MSAEEQASIELENRRLLQKLEEVQKRPWGQGLVQGTVETPFGRTLKKTLSMAGLSSNQQSRQREQARISDEN